jgi:hypothetical protein
MRNDARDRRGTWSVDAFHREGVFPKGWPADVADRLESALVRALTFNVTTLTTDARGEVVYGDGLDPVRDWMRILGLTEDDPDIALPPGTLRPLVEHVAMDTLIARFGLATGQAILARCDRELADEARLIAQVQRLLGACAEDVQMLEQAHANEAAARDWDAKARDLDTPG